MDLQSNTGSEKYFNFLINASNQANLSGTNNVSPVQINSLFLFVSPFEIEKCQFEGLNIDLKVDVDGSIWVNNNKFKAIEIQPGVSILGIVSR